jgi:hypothetical protein
MANINRPMGFRPTRYRNGADWNGEASMYAFSASNVNSAFVFDLVAFDSTNRSNSLVDPFMPGLPFVGATAASTTVTTAAQRGVVVGFLPEPEFNQSVTASLGLKYRLASTLRYAMVIDDPNVYFEAQESAGSYTSASNNMIGRVAGATISASKGNVTTGVSNALLTSENVTAALRPWKVSRLLPTIDNFNFTAGENPTNARYEVLPFYWDLSLAYAAGTSSSATLVAGV